MNKNLFYLFEISFAVLIFILAVSLNFDWHNDLNSLISDMEANRISSHKIVQNAANTVDILETKPAVSGKKRLQNLICSDIIMRNKKNYGDGDFAHESLLASNMRIWLDFKQSYVDEMSEILDLEEEIYKMNYIYNSNYEIVEIRVERK